MNSFMVLGGGMLIFYSVVLWQVSIKPIWNNRNQPITDEEIVEHNRQVRTTKQGGRE